MSAQLNAPIIIKRKKKIVGGGHHGGAWKVAYADFVTAMMAFFMLMWLLNATTEQQRKGIADYFAPTISVNRISGGGDGMFGGESIFVQQTLAQNGTGSSTLRMGAEMTESLTPEQAEAQAAAIAEVAALRDLEEELLGRGGESTISDQALRHIVTRVTDEGLVIEIFDVEGATLFVRDTALPSPVTREIAGMLAQMLRTVTNDVAIRGHLVSQASAQTEGTGWDLSVDRVRAMRTLMEDGGFDPNRVARLTGLSDRIAAVPDVTALRNNRIEVIVLRSDQ